MGHRGWVMVWCLMVLGGMRPHRNPNSGAASEELGAVPPGAMARIFARMDDEVAQEGDPVRRSERRREALREAAGLVRRNGALYDEFQSPSQRDLR